MDDADDLKSVLRISIEVQKSIKQQLLKEIDELERRKNMSEDSIKMSISTLHLLKIIDKKKLLTEQIHNFEQNILDKVSSRYQKLLDSKEKLLERIDLVKNVRKKDVISEIESNSGSTSLLEQITKDLEFQEQEILAKKQSLESKLNLAKKNLRDVQEMNLSMKKHNVKEVFNEEVNNESEFNKRGSGNIDDTLKRKQELTDDIQSEIKSSKIKIVHRVKGRKSLLEKDKDRGNTLPRNFYINK